MYQILQCVWILYKQLSQIVWCVRKLWILILVNEESMILKLLHNFWFQIVFGVFDFQHNPLVWLPYLFQYKAVFTIYRRSCATACYDCSENIMIAHKDMENLVPNIKHRSFILRSCSRKVFCMDQLSRFKPIIYTKVIGRIYRKIL